jgi:hypothetical protein
MEVFGMKKALVFAISAAFLFQTAAFAADKPVSEASKADPIKIAPVRTAKMNATGKIIEISEKTIKIERTVKDKVETMAFVLDKPVESLAVNDKVKIVYIEKDGNLLASGVAKIAPKKAGGKKDVVAEKSAPQKK